MAKQAIKKTGGKKMAVQTAKVSAPQAKISPAKSRELELERRRDAIVAQYMPYATSIANRVYQTMSSAVDYDDVLCNARLGLLEAAKRFDDGQQVEFRTFAYYRIKGAIFDGLRRTGWLPRSLYSKIKFEEASNEYLQHMSQRSNVFQNDEEREHEIVDTVNSLASIYVISLDEGDEELDIEDVDAPDVAGRAEFHQIRTYMREAINTLPPKEKQLIMMYYFQNRTLEEIGEKLDLSKSWTCRLHARALEMLLGKVRTLTGNEGETAKMQEGEDK